MIEVETDITTPDGEMKTFIYRPEHDGPHPVVLYLMDAPSIRPALHEMASRLATAGCAFLATSLKYKGPEGASHSSHGSARTARLGPDMRVLDATSLSALN